MLTIKHNGKIIKRIPNKLSEIPLEQGIQILDVLGKDEPDMITKISIIAMLGDLDVNSMINWYPESIDAIFDNLEINQKNECYLGFYRTFKLNGTHYGLADYDEFTLHEYAEVEFWLEQGDNYYSHIGEIMAVLFRPIKRKNKNLKNIFINIYQSLKKPKFLYKDPQLVMQSWKNYEIEEYEDKYLFNAEDFQKFVDFNFGYAVVKHFLDWRQKLRGEYILLFKSEEQLEMELEDELTPNERELEFADWWGYYHLINQVSENLFERDAWYKKKLREFYKFLSYNKQKSLYYGRTGE